MNIKKKSYYIGRAIIVIAIIAIAVSVGYDWGHTKAQSVEIPPTLTGVYNPDASTTDFSIFWQVWNLLNENYVATHSTSTPTDQEKLYGAIQGLAASYGDPYTVFFPPAQEQDFQTQIQGDFEGVGMEVSEKDGVLTVVAPLKGSPADKAGIKAGDIILKINGTVTDNMSVDDAVNMIRGPKGSTVTLTIVHGTGSPVVIPIVRDVINIPTLETKTVGGNIFDINLYTFTADSPDLFRDAMRQFIASGDKKLIIDLRGNPGGYLDAAVDMASWFTPIGDTIVEEDFGGKQPDIYHRSKGYDVINGSDKVVILVDGGSASASEIFSGALHDYGIATLVGEQTFGKGSVQELIPITDDTALKVTVARWLTPKGVSISQTGITPDYVVPMTDADVAAGKDPQLDKAVQLLSQ